MNLDALIRSRKAGYTLPAPFYLSKEVYEQDVARIFGRYWIYAGVEPEIAEPGDFFTVEIGTDSIIIVRDDDMQINAFHNVCRHRGARLRTCRQRHCWQYRLPLSPVDLQPVRRADPHRAHGRGFRPAASSA